MRRMTTQASTGRLVAMIEQWKPCPGFEDLYSVSDQGRVRRDSAAAGARAGRILKPGRSVGYPQVILCRGGRRFGRKIHELVAPAFLGPRPEGLDTDHKDGDKLNNRPANLEYCTRAENMRRAYMAGLCLPGLRAKLTKEDIPWIRLWAAKGYTQKVIGAAFGVAGCTVSDILAGRTWSYIPLAPGTLVGQDAV